MDVFISIKRVSIEFIFFYALLAASKLQLIKANKLQLNYRYISKLQTMKVTQRLRTSSNLHWNQFINVFSILPSKSLTLLNSEILPNACLVISQLYNQRNLKSILQIFANATSLIKLSRETNRFFFFFVKKKTTWWA